MRTKVGGVRGRKVVYAVYSISCEGGRTTVLAHYLTVVLIWVEQSMQSESRCGALSWDVGVDNKTGDHRTVHAKSSWSPQCVRVDHSRCLGLRTISLWCQKDVQHQMSHKEVWSSNPQRSEGAQRHFWVFVFLYSARCFSSVLCSMCWW